MTDDHLRFLLERTDPLPAEVPIDAADSPRVRALLEEIMSTSIDDRPTAPSVGAHTARPRRARRVAFVAGAAAAAIAVVAIGAAVIGGDDAAPTRQAFAVAGAEPTMSSCIQFDVAILAEMPVAFAGTVTGLTDTTVTVEVERWYRAPEGATTDLVDLTLPATTSSASLDGVAFVTGERYLLTAAEGNVNGCGFSGLATPELEAAFEAAFG